MPRRVLITGITGFAGSHLAERLVARGDEVHGIAHEAPPHPYLAAVAERVRMHRADILDPAAVRGAVEAARPELIYHLAGQAVPTLASADPLAAIRVNVVGTSNVAAALEAAPEARLVAASSADVYGIPERSPVDEDAPLRPTNVYAATKVAAEAVLRDAGRHGRRVAVLRPSNQIGPRQHPRLAASEFAHRIAEAEAGLADAVIQHGQLEPRREFVDVRDMAAAYEAAGDLDHRGADVFNVGGGAVVSIGEILATLIRLARIPIRTELDQDRVRAGVPDALVLSSERFMSATAWRPTLTLDRSLSDTLDFWRKELGSADPAPPVRAGS